VDATFESYIRSATKWAEERLGSTDYNTKCLAFVEDAYEMANGVEVFGGDTANESALAYGAAENNGLPPLGAFVFYDCTGELRGERKNWGHVGLHIGDRMVVHAWDKVRIDDYLEVEKLGAAPGWSQPRYTGWAPIERVFRGYRRVGRRTDGGAA
jgi:cell wall-associated NlpC family hydrolase